MPERLRLFFALWPDDEVRHEMWSTGARLHKLWNGRRMRAETLHMTLVFLGDTPSNRLDELKHLADSIRIPAFSLELDRASCWRHNKVGFLEPMEPPDALLQLAHGLEDALDSAGFEFDARPYKPHVTVLRNTRCTTQVPFVPVTWNVSDFALIASVTGESGASYEVLGRWKLPLARSSSTK